MSQDAEFERLVDLYYAPLYRFAFSLTRQESEAGDLTQQTFYIWATKGYQLKDKSKVKSWLFTTLHREYLEKHRKMIRFPQVELADAEAELPEVLPASWQRLDADIILKALQQIGEPFQSSVALFYLEDYTYPEIAAVLEVPLGTVKSRISRGLGQLQRLIAERDSGEVRREAHE
jgi:RNA polymerase sigma-70 factor (ECF subfamily)